jgi:hypothetical protein
MDAGRKYERGLAIFKTNHLSVYTVTYEAPSDDAAADDDNNQDNGGQGDDDSDGETLTGSGGGGCDSGMGMAALLALGLVSMMVRAKRG